VNDENRRAGVREDLDLSRGALAAARLLLANDLLPDVLNRAYYAAHHAARALLLSRGVEVRSHSALRAELGRHLVKPGLLPVDMARSLRVLQADREEADYGRFVSVDRALADQAVEQASAFVDVAEAILRAEGWLDEPAG
jgi:uncharacterized protein (UPF0332 family)